MNATKKIKSWLACTLILFALVVVGVVILFKVGKTLNEDWKARDGRDACVYVKWSKRIHRFETAIWVYKIQKWSKNRLMEHKLENWEHFHDKFNIYQN